MRHLCSVLALLSAVLLSPAQSKWSFDHISTDEGLSTGTVNCVFKDGKGYVWIGTIDGLNRYDGYELTIFKNDKNDSSSISGNIISSIQEDVKGNIWIGTRNNGISIFNWERESFVRLADKAEAELPGGQIRAIHKTFDNKILVGVEGGGILIYDVDSYIPEKIAAESSDLSDNTILSIVEASEKEYWVTSLATTIDLFNVETRSFKNTPYNPEYEPVENNRKNVLQDSKGMLWLGTDGKGLIQIDPNDNTQKVFNTSNSGLNSDIITTLFKDESGLLYVGTDGMGINVLNPETETFSYIQSSLLDPRSLSSDAIYQIYEDNSGVIWVSTFRGGVNTYSPYRTKFGLYKQIPYEDNSLSFASVIDVMETEDGSIWIGTDGGGLDQLDPLTGQFTHYKHDPDNPNSISTNVAIALEEDSNGYLWIGTYAGGVNRLDRRTGSIKRFLPDPTDSGSINSRNVWYILEDSQGVLWFGLLGGLDKYDPSTESFTHYNSDGSEGSLSSDLIFAMLEDSKGNFWIGTENAGLNLFDRTSEVFSHFKHSDSDTASILNNNIRTLFEDSKGQLWVGTSEGANIMNVDTKEIIPAKVNALLPSLVINGIREDEQENLWISTNNGLSKYNPDEHTIQNFGKSDGLQGNEFNYTTSFKANDGTMYFGGVNGLNAFHPSEVKMSSFDPIIAITEIKLFDRPITEIKNKDGRALIEKSVESLSELTLRHDQNVLEITFSSLDFTSPSSNKYRYKLEEFDQKWIYTDSRKRTASYTNLDPDTYTFIVEGTNSDGVWSANSKKLVLVILPPWWETWWFRVGTFLVLAAIIFFFIRWRTRAIKHQKSELNRQIEEATDQVRSQNLTLQEEQAKLELAIEETNQVVNEAIESGNFSARIDLQNKSGTWHDLGLSINTLFDSISFPFQNINKIVGAMASSNLTLRYDHEANGDILKLTSSLNYALDNLSDLISTIQQTTNIVGESSTEMQNSSDEMSVGVSEIAASTSELSRGAQEQVTRIDEASNELENIKEFSMSVSDQAQSINQAAERGVSLSNEGEKQMNVMDEGMKKMEQTSSETADSIQTLLVKSGEISSILNSIKEISVETNMLALNAAIEAAKAGDSGRGFAVVANQIRRLAENSSAFASEIECIVNEVQNSVSAVSQQMSEMSDEIRESVSASHNASTSFSELASSYEETFSLSEKIVNLTDLQFEKVKGVVHLMEGVVVIAEEAAAGTEQIASSSNTLSTGMSEYQGKTKKVSEAIIHLNEKMKEFRLNKPAKILDD